MLRSLGGLGKFGGLRHGRHGWNGRFRRHGRIRTLTTESPLRVLGIDPGLNHTGWAILEVRSARDRRSSLRASSILEGRRHRRAPLRHRHGLSDVIARHAPELAAIERVFVNVNPQSTLLLGQARGAAIVACGLTRLCARRIHAFRNQEAVTGTGRADKLMIVKMIRTRLSVDRDFRPDEADAAAAALCLIQRLPLRALERSGGSSRSFATARRGRFVRGARASWTNFAQTRTKKDSK